MIFVLLALLAAGAYFALRDGGWLEQVTEDRVRAALMDNGVPEPMAVCMAEKMTDRLTISQLRKLEQLAPQAGENSIPASFAEASARLQRVDDPEAIRILTETGTTCGIGLIGDQLKSLF